jgi:hypothetical protein
MRGSLSITLKGCGDDHDKLYILQTLTRCSVQSPTGKMLSDIVRATKCGMVIEEAIAALEQQWGSTSTEQASGSNQWTPYSGGPSQFQHRDQLYLRGHQPPDTDSQLPLQPPDLHPIPYNDESPPATFVASQPPADHNRMPLGFHGFSINYSLDEFNLYPKSVNYKPTLRMSDISGQPNDSMG